jgi:general secretion pathway protein I
VTRSPIPSIRKDSGFSLLEVLVAFTLLAMSLGVLMNIFASSTTNVAVSAEHSKALVIAESALAAAGHTAALDTNLSGRALDGRFAWRVNSSPLTIENTDPKAVQSYLLTATVSWRSGSKSRSVDLATIKTELVR